jgi:hypothetical protein
MYRVILLPIVCCVFLAGVALAGDVPEVKAGLWSTTTTNGDPKSPAQTGTMCTSTALLQTIFEQRFKGANPPCKRSQVERNGATITEQNECSFGDTVTKTKVVTVITGDTAVHTEIHEQGKSTVIISDSKFVGACPVGMQLGDFVGPNGMKFNVLHPQETKTPTKAP